MRLLVVDDEVYTRKGIAGLIDWKKYGIQYVLEAEDGMQAYEIAMWFQPNIILTDIKMPKMNGIEFAKKIRQLCPEVHVIFVSSYMEIEYLKSAIQLSAVDYIQKPVNINVLEAAINKSIGMIQRASAYKKESEGSLKIKKQLFTVMLSYENNRILQDSDEQLTFINNVKDCYCIIVETVNNHILDEFEGIALGCGFEYALMGMRRPNYYVGLIGKVERLVEIDNLKLLASKLLDESVLRVSYSIIPREPADFWIAYNEAAAAYERSFFLPEEGVFEFVMRQPYMMLNFDLQDEFKVLIENGSKNVYEWMDKLKVEVSRNYYSVEQIKAFYYSLINTVIEYNPVISKKLYLANEHSIEPKQLWDKINHARNINVLHNILQETIDYYFETDEENSLSRLIRDAVRYIHKNYTNPDLSIVDIANAVHLSSAYLNLSFKKEKGITLKQYIISYRLECAKKLLMDRNRKVKDIAAECGFFDNGYFAKVFRKEIGVTPLEYRENYM